MSSLAPPTRQSMTKRTMPIASPLQKMLQEGKGETGPQGDKTIVRGQMRARTNQHVLKVMAQAAQPLLVVSYFCILNYTSVNSKS